MSLQLINNGDLGETARNKINLAIEALNTLLTVDSYSMVVYDNSPTIMGVGTDTEACDAITMGSSHTVYFTKGSGNSDNGSIEMGDSVYSDSNLTTPLSNNYYGAVITMMNKSIYIVGGIADMVNDCGGGAVGGNFNAWDNYVNPTGEADASTACSSIYSATEHVLYITKDPNNFGGDSVPEVNDQLFTDSMLTNPAPMSVYFGWQDMMMAQNKSILIGMNGVISQIDNC